MKQCITCQLNKSFEYFGVNKRFADNLSVYCKPCERSRQKAGRAKRAARDPASIELPALQKCQKCHVTKPGSEFHRDLARTCGLNRNCRPCMANQCNHYREKYIDDDAVKFKLRIMVHQARTRATRDSVPFEITTEYLREHFSDLTHCPIIGIELDWKVRGNPKPNSPSLDKIIPSLGYVPYNVQVISHQANFMKNDADIPLLRRFCEWGMKFTDEMR